MADIVIIGGGIGGLSAAIALRQYGFDVEVFEEAPVLLELGAAIALWPNAMRALAHLRLTEEVLANAGVINEIRWLTHEGKTLNFVRIANPEAPAVAVHRAELQKILLRSVPSSQIKLGHSFSTQADESESISVGFTNGHSTACRVLIGSDGVHSEVRKQISNDTAPAFLGYIVWRGISAARLKMESADAAVELHGQGKRFGIGPVGNGRTGWWASANTEIETSLSREVPTDAHDELLHLFDGWCAPVDELIRSTQSILRTEASDLPSTRTWGRGWTTLLGDAIHPTTPNLGQGGCMAIEDAVVLARCLEKYGLHEDALRAYERVRYGRTATITYASRLYGQIGQWENRLATGLRSTVISALPQAVIKRSMKIVFDYDAATVRI